MTTIPDEFEQLDETIISNADREICFDVAKAIQGKKLYAWYTGWNFCGKVWWVDEKWHCEVWVYGFPKEVISAKTLDEIMADVSYKYGYE